MLIWRCTSNLSLCLCTQIRAKRWRSKIHRSHWPSLILRWLLTCRRISLSVRLLLFIIWIRVVFRTRFSLWNRANRLTGLSPRIATVFRLCHRIPIIYLLISFSIVSRPPWSIGLLCRGRGIRLNRSLIHLLLLIRRGCIRLLWWRIVWLLLLWWIWRVCLLAWRRIIRLLLLICTCERWSLLLHWGERRYLKIVKWRFLIWVWLLLLIVRWYLKLIRAAASILILREIGLATSPKDSFYRIKSRGISVETCSRWLTIISSPISIIVLLLSSIECSIRVLCKSKLWSCSALLSCLKCRSLANGVSIIWWRR